MVSLGEVVIIDSISDDSRYDWSVEAINAPKVWEHTKGEGVKVAVIDTGIDMQHNDFFKTIKGTMNAFDKKTNLITDNHGHGTHVAGLIAGSKTGVAPNVDLYVSNVLDYNGSGTMARVLDGITYAINLDVDILCMSLGLPKKLPQILEQRIKMAYKKGITIVCATGNNGKQSVNHPASYDFVIGVGGVNANLERAYFSNYGYDMDVVAPSVDIMSTYMDNKYALMTGTSMASPLVAGGLALVKSYYRKQGVEISPAEMKQMLSRLNEKKDRFIGHGVIDVVKMIGLEN